MSVFVRVSMVVNCVALICYMCGIYLSVSSEQLIKAGNQTRWNGDMICSHYCSQGDT